MADDRLTERLREISFEGETGAARELREEARRTLDAQVQSLDDVDTKAIKILRVNLVLTGVVLTFFSFAAQTEGPAIEVGEFLNLYMGAGVAALILSSAMAALTYTASDVEAGVDPADVARLLELDVTSAEVEPVLAKSYARWIAFNDETNLRNTPLITATLLLVVAALAFVSLGVYDAVLAPVPWYLTATTLAALVAVTYLTGFVGQVRRAIASL